MTTSHPHRHVIITGGASGIGRAAAHALLDDDVSVTVMDIDEMAWSKSGIEPRGGRYLTVDVSDEASVEAAFRTAAREAGGIHGVIHSAGVVIDTSTDIRDLSTEVWQRVIDINLTGSFFVTRAAARHMRSGLVALIGSQGGVTMRAGTLAYGASKGGVHGLTMSVDHALAHLRIVNVMPASVDTPLLRSVASAAGVPIETALATTTPAEVVGVSIAALFRDESRALISPILTA